MTVILWYLVLLALGWAAYPLTARALSRLPDAGLGLLRIVGLVVILGPVWWLASFFPIPFKPVTLWVALGGVAALCWGLELFRPVARLILRSQWRRALLYEALTLLGFLAYLGFRGFQPDIAYTEKPMDLAFLASAIRTNHLPLPDPWFAGQPANYYTFGYIMMGALAKLAGAPPGIAFVLALATLFALCLVASVSVGANLARFLAGPSSSAWAVWVGGAFSSLFLLFLGNLVTPWRLLTRPHQTLSQSWWEGIGWNASRVIIDTGFPFGNQPHQTINEFPAFSFVLGDLHPHLLDLPFFLLVIGLAVALVQGYEQPWALGLAAGTLGLLDATNSWDMPTGLALLAVSALLAPRTAGWVYRALAYATTVAGLALAALPFTRLYIPSFGADPSVLPPALAQLPILSTIIRTFGIVIWNRSSASSLVLVHGFFLLLGWGWTIVAFRGLPERLRPSPFLAAIIAGVVAVLSFATHFPALFLFGLPAVVLALSAWIGDWQPATRFVLGALALAWGLIIAVELVYLQDVFGDRMNTVFKVYFQVWAIHALILGGSLPALLTHLGQIRRWLVPASRAAVAVGCLATLTYLPLSAWKWTNGFERWQGIDGLAYIQRFSPSEAKAINWLARTAPTNATVLELPGCSYGVTNGLPQNRVSMATGIPTVAGWFGHEYQWRRGSPAQLQELSQRRQLATAVYTMPSMQSVTALLRRVPVTYIYIGTLERVGLGPGCPIDGTVQPAALEQTLQQAGWQRVFADGDVAIYQRLPRESIVDDERGSVLA